MTVSSKLTSVAFIGGGNLATAMVRGLCKLAARPILSVGCPEGDAAGVFASLGVRVTADNVDAIREAQVVVLAVKPQVVPVVLAGLASAWSRNQVLVSVAAGITIAQLASLLPPGARIVRAMPNTPIAVGQGMTGICHGGGPTREQDMALADALFRECSVVMHLDGEDKIDAVTAVSGSGPAYIFRTVEALVAAARGLGFSQKEAEILVGQTLRGSTTLLLERGVAHAGALRVSVTSPNGTTAAALAVVDREAIDRIWMDALRAAHRRSRELGSKL